MAQRVPSDVQHMNPETIESLQDLIQALRDSINYHTEAANKIDDDYVKQTLLAIAAERRDIHDTIGGFVALTDEKPIEDGTFLGSMRAIWTALRAGLNAGDATVVLIEAERAEDVIVNKFKTILPKVAGNPINDMLLKYFGAVKSGHDRVLALRNAYQNA